MTTNTKDIEVFAEENCIGINFIELDRLLEKLDHEELDLFLVMLEKVYEAGHNDATCKAEQTFQEQYNDGYSDGREVGYEEGKECGYEDGYSAGCDR